MIFWAFGRRLEIKVGWVFNLPGNFLSNEHKNTFVLSKNGWEKEVQRCQPPKNSTKITKIDACSQKCFLASRTVVTFKSHSTCLKAWIIKWITYGEPPVGLKTHQGSKLGHSAVILYIVLLSWPCIMLKGQSQKGLTHIWCWFRLSRTFLSRFSQPDAPNNAKRTPILKPKDEDWEFKKWQMFAQLCFVLNHFLLLGCFLIIASIISLLMFGNWC